MAKNYFRRYEWLLGLLWRGARLTLDEIKAAWLNAGCNETGDNLPERTFFNHKNAILEMFGVEIKCDGFHRYYIDKDEIAGNDNIRTMMLDAMFLNSVMTEAKSAGLSGRVLYEKFTEGTEYLGDIINAMKDARRLKVTYRSFYDDAPSDWMVDPYALKMFKQRWYLFGNRYRNASDTKGELRIYALDRVKGLEISDETFKLPKKFNASAFFDDYYGVTIGTGGKVCRVKLKVDLHQAPYFRSLQLHSTQRELPVAGDPEHVYFVYDMVPTDDLVREIMSKGSGVEVCEPESLRNRIKENLERMCLSYGIEVK